VTARRTEAVKKALVGVSISTVRRRRKLVNRKSSDSGKSAGFRDMAFHLFENIDRKSSIFKNIFFIFYGS
jgi:hypothetical protein